VYNMLAVILHDRGDFLGAEAYFERAVELNPNYTEALLNLAVTYNDLGKYEAARQVYARIRRDDGKAGILDPYARGKIANMHADLAQAYSDAGCKQEAIAELRRSVALCPTFADLQVRLGTLYRDAGNLVLAREHYEAARDINPRYAPARVLLGVVLLSLGQPDQAIAEWRAALAVDPDNKSARMYLRMVEDQRNALARATEAGADAATETGTGTETGTATGAGAETGTATGADAETGTGADTGAEMAADAETAADAAADEGPGGG
jgi:tetratricopeptide (TPR) repeat protein